MRSIPLPGWNLAGRLPSISGIKRAGGYIAMVRHLPQMPGRILRVPRVIALVNGSHDDPGEYARITSVFRAVFSRIAAAMPDAILLAEPSVILDPAGQVEGISFLPWTYVPPDTPVLGCDFLDVYVGSGSATPGQLGVTLDAVSSLRGGFAAYCVRIFELESEQPEGNVPMAEVAAAASAMGVNVELVGATSDATEVSLAQIISDHYGVSI